MRTQTPTPLRRPGLAAVALVVAVSVAAALLAWHTPFAEHLRGRRTVVDRIDRYGPAARARLRPAFARAGLAYPPAIVTLVVLKKERRVEVYAAGVTGRQRRITSYPILAASGRLGPKRAAGDGQVPEGVYAVEALNPNSDYHLALRVGYPNAFDRRMARVDGRFDLGGDIEIHGGAKSIGCIAVGDTAAEDLFVLAADAGISQTTIVICPVDFRRAADPVVPGGPSWLPELYGALRARLAELAGPPSGVPGPPGSRPS